jgi:NAD+ synthase
MLTGLKIVIAQTNPTVGNIAANTDLILKHLKTHEDQSDLIVFSELILSGYPPEDLILKPSFIDHCHAAVETLKTQSAAFDCAALIGTPYYGDDGQVYNTALLIHDGEIIGRADKHHLPNYGVFDEKRTFTRGDLPEPISYKNHKLGVMICEDLWHKDVAKHLKSAGAEMLIALNGSPYETNKHNERLSHAKARVSETGLPLLYVNQVGGQDELVFDGASFAMNEGGDIADQAPIFEEHIAPLSFITHDLPDTHEQIYRACVLGLRDYVHKNGFSGVVLGLSGGIDSAVAAIMARDAVGAQNLDCIMMPSAFTSQDSLYDAQTLATRLGCTYDIIPITEPLAAFENIFAQTSPDSTRAGLAGGGAQPLKGVTHENIQSRIRGVTLMALSNSSGKILLTTGNKSEMATGYATLYGDMCGGYNPLKDIYKSKLYDMAKTVAAIKDVIPERIVTRPPTAELKDDQTDQDTLPDYDVLDAILKCLIEREMSLEDTAAKTKQDAALVLRVATMLDRNEYKRSQAAPGTKITPKSFGRDRRYPMTNGFKG